MSKNQNESKKTDMSTVTHDMGHSLGEMVSHLSDDVSEMGDLSAKYVKKNPAKSLAIAAAAGVVIGSILTLILTRRRS